MFAFVGAGNEEKSTSSLYRVSLFYGRLSLCLYCHCRYELRIVVVVEKRLDSYLLSSRYSRECLRLSQRCDHVDCGLLLLLLPYRSGISSMLLSSTSLCETWSFTAFLLRPQQFTQQCPRSSGEHRKPSEAHLLDHSSSGELLPLQNPLSLPHLLLDQQSRQHHRRLHRNVHSSSYHPHYYLEASWQVSVSHSSYRDLNSSI